MNAWFQLGLLTLCAAASCAALSHQFDPGGHRAAGAAAWRADDFEGAARHWAAAEPVEEATAELLYDRVLAEIRRGRPRESIPLIERFATRISGFHRDFAKRSGEECGEFLKGHAAWSMATAAEQLSFSPEAGVPEIDAAILAFTRARGHWRAAGKDDGVESWALALNNAALAASRITALQARREEAASKGAQAGANKMEKRQDQIPTDGQTEEVEQDAPGPPSELGPEELRRILDRLAAKELEKRDLRRDKRAAQRRPGERDW
jgi:hypothetical protein